MIADSKDGNSKQKIKCGLDGMMAYRGTAEIQCDITQRKHYLRLFHRKRNITFRVTFYSDFNTFIKVIG
jgi:hypothetical protein